MLKQIITGAALIAATYLPTSALAQETIDEEEQATIETIVEEPEAPQPNVLVTGYAEVFAGYNGVVGDFRLGVYGEQFSIFTRHMPSLSFETGQPDYFGLVDLIKNITPEFGFVIEPQFVLGDVSLRAGFQYYTELNGFSAFCLGTMGINPDDFGLGLNAEVVGIFTYNKQLKSGPTLSLSGEVYVVGINKDGPSFAYQKARVGFGNGNLTLGIGVDVYEIQTVDELGSDDVLVDLNLGGYALGRF